MDVILAQVVNGIAIGGIYALLTTGFNLLILVAGTLNFAYPHMVVMSMYVSWMVFRVTNDNLPLGIAAAIGSAIGMSLASEPLFRPLVRRGASVSTFVLSLGIAIILTDVMSRQINRGRPIAFPTALSVPTPIARVGMATLTIGQLLVILGSVGAVVGLLYLLYRTKQGRAFRAMAQNPWTARLVGIPMGKTSFHVYLMSGLMGGVSAVFLPMYLGAAAGDLGGILSVKMLAVAILAGLGNLRGGLIAGLILGIAESLAVGFISGAWANAIAFTMLLVVIMWRPQGLFGVRA